MRVMPTTTVSVLRGTSRTEFDDEADSETVASSGHAASLIERTQNVYPPNSGTPMTVRTVVCRLDSSVQVLNGDRIRDEGTGVVYYVSNLVSPQVAGFVDHLRLDLERVT